MRPAVEEVGNRYGSMVVTQRLPKCRNTHVVWELLCDCGRTVQRRGDRMRKLGPDATCGKCGKDQAALVISKVVIDQVTKTVSVYVVPEDGPETLLMEAPVKHIDADSTQLTVLTEHSPTIRLLEGGGGANSPE